MEKIKKSIDALKSNRVENANDLRKIVGGLIAPEGKTKNGTYYAAPGGGHFDNDHN